MNYGHILSLIQCHLTSLAADPGLELMSCEINNVISMVEKGVILLKHKRIAKALILLLKACEMGQDVMSISRELFSIMALARIIGNLNGVSMPEIKKETLVHGMKKAV